MSLYTFFSRNDILLLFLTLKNKTKQNLRPANQSTFFIPSFYSLNYPQFHLPTDSSSPRCSVSFRFHTTKSFNPLKFMEVSCVWRWDTQKPIASYMLLTVCCTSIFSSGVSTERRCKVQRGWGPYMVDTGPVGKWIGQGRLLQRNDIERQT